MLTLETTAPVAAIVAPAERVTFNDIWQAEGSPCCLCGCVLDPTDADHTKLAHLSCATRELQDIANDAYEAEYGEYLDTFPVWPSPEQVESDAAVYARFDGEAQF